MNDKQKAEMWEARARELDDALYEAINTIKILKDRGNFSYYHKHEIDDRIWMLQQTLIPF